MRVTQSIQFACLVVFFGYIAFSFIPAGLSIVFWPQSLAERYGVDAWQTWPVTLEFAIPVLGWALIFFLAGECIRWFKKSEP
jgi:hypothetical protein